MKTALYFLGLVPFFTNAQTVSKPLTDSLQFITLMPHCLEPPANQPGFNSIFWRIVKQKDAIIDDLIGKIDDTTETQAVVHWFGGNWAVGDIAHEALREIIHDLPTFKLLGVKFDKNGCGECSYWYYLRDDYRNRIKFKQSIKKWYAKNKDNLVWVKAPLFVSECMYHNPNGGYFVVRK